MKRVVKRRGEKPVSRVTPRENFISNLEKATSPHQARRGQLGFRFIDLFAGIGGFRCAMTAVGGHCVFSSEWDKFAVQTYEKWYGNEHIYREDIRNLDPYSVPDHEVLCAGFPCQPFSIAGVSKKNALGREHGFKDAKQGNLFFAIMEIISAKKPPMVILENVKNLRSHDKGNTYKTITSLLSEDYIVFDEIVDARSWVPQHRERIFLVCFSKKVFGASREEIPFTFPRSKNPQNPRFSSILEKEPDSKYMLTDHLWNYLVAYKAKHEKKGNGFGYGIADPNGVSRTMSARYYKDGSEILVKHKGWRNPRRITPNEAKKLMGYEDRFAALFGHNNGFPIVVSDTQAYKQFGNTVVPLVVEQIAKSMIKTVKSLYP
jgi:DNA (cytosine-5)-methyltransferase 1